MPQLDTIHITVTYLWTWFVLLMITQKIKTLTMARPNMPQLTTKTKKTPSMPWL